MKSTGIKKIAIKAGTADGDIFKSLVTDEAKAKRLMVEPGLSVYLMNDGTTVEVYGAGACYPDYLFMKSNMVVSFKVNNLQTAVRSLQQKGAMLLGAIETVCSSYSYCHLLTNEETVIGLYEQG